MKKILIRTENDEYQIIQSLKLNREKRNKLHEVFIEGIECIKQAVSSHVEITRIIAASIDNLSDWGKDLIAKNENAKIIEMSEQLYGSLCDKTVPSELLATAKIRQNSVSDITGNNPFIVVFDRPSDYGNLGTLIRSASAFCVDGIFIIGHGVDVYESRVIRASLGSVFSMKIVYMESMELLRSYIESQKSINSMLVVGTDSTGEISLATEKISRPVMVVIGNEARGMSIKLKELCDKIVKIPMRGVVNSLNVSCAASIVMWEIFRNEVLMKNGE